MIKQDFTEFGLELAKLCVLSNTELSEEAIQVWFKDLSDWTLRDVTWALEKYRKELEYGRPMPAGIIKHLTARRPEGKTWNARIGGWVRDDGAKPEKGTQPQLPAPLKTAYQQRQEGGS